VLLQPISQRFTKRATRILTKKSPKKIRKLQKMIKKLLLMKLKMRKANKPKKRQLTIAVKKSTKTSPSQNEGKKMPITLVMYTTPMRSWLLI